MEFDLGEQHVEGVAGLHAELIEDFFGFLEPLCRYAGTEQGGGFGDARAGLEAVFLPLMIHAGIVGGLAGSQFGDAGKSPGPGAGAFAFSNGHGWAGRSL